MKKNPFLLSMDMPYNLPDSKNKETQSQKEP